VPERRAEVRATGDEDPLGIEHAARLRVDAERGLVLDGAARVERAHGTHRADTRDADRDEAGGDVGHGLGRPTGGGHRHRERDDDGRGNAAGARLHMHALHERRCVLTARSMTGTRDPGVIAA
jgi:hypothetical protein